MVARAVVAAVEDCRYAVTHAFVAVITVSKEDQCAKDEAAHLSSRASAATKH